MISLQTNVNSLVAQQNLRVNSLFQSRTIQQLTSGYRFNEAEAENDDDVAELTQGVRNANDSAGQLQIVDGELGNIAQILDRLKTLATESDSDSFTRDHWTLNNEYQTLLQEVDRQASKTGLVNLDVSTPTFVVDYIDSSGPQQSVNATVTSTGTTGITVANAVSQLNQQLSTLGLTAAENESGSLVLSATAAYSL